MSTIPMAEARDLAMLFHLNSEPWMNIQAYDEPTVLHAFKIAEHIHAFVNLPRAESTPLFELIRTRVSCRQFARRPMLLQELATLLHQAYGVLGLRESNGLTMHHRPVPSAGALYPLELYVIANTVDGLAPGAYHYAPWHHRLELVRENVDIESLMPNLQEQRYILEANALLFLTAVFARTMTKYGPRGYRYILLEAGHVAQNICLLAAEREMATLCIGGFRDSHIEELLCLDSRREGTVYALAIGRSERT